MKQPCPDCEHPMHWSPVSETWSCMFCQGMPIKHWVEDEGKLVVVDLQEWISKLNERDGIA